ncbi:type VII secretion target [Actinoplanes sp. NPDC020271]|uniref:type VII secretion target n=1 Tax=Actinoplanes sp. NPDC020271 TaxID=3363896 RepID=UPI0037B73FAE
MIASADGVLADPFQIRRHATDVRALQDRLAAVRAASSAIEHDSAAFGLLCSWLPAVLAARHRRQDELTAYLAENLGLLAEDLHATATDYESTDSRSATTIRDAGGLP